MQAAEELHVLRQGLAGFLELLDGRFQVAERDLAQFDRLAQHGGNLVQGAFGPDLDQVSLFVEIDVVEHALGIDGNAADRLHDAAVNDLCVYGGPDGRDGGRNRGQQPESKRCGNPRMKKDSQRTPPLQAGNAVPKKPL